MNTIIYKYRLLDPLNWDEDCREQLFRMNRLWNALVEIEHEHRQRVRDLISSDDAVKPIQDKLNALRERQTELRKERKLRRQKAQARIDTKEIDTELKALAAEIQPLAAQCKATRKESIDRVRAPLDALEEQRKLAVKTARQQSQLYWGNYNAVCQSYQTARSRAMKENAELRFHRFTGEGRFVVQLINGASVDEILTARKQVSIDPILQPVPNRGGKPLPRLSITIYTRDGEPRLLQFPLVYDRELPDCRIQQVTVMREKIATHWRYHAIFQCRTEDVPAVTTANTAICGINLGFRQVPGDRPNSTALKVATMFDGAHNKTLVLPSRWMYRMDDVERIQCERDENLNAILDTLRAEWPSRPKDFKECVILDDQLSNVLRAPKVGMAKLAAIVLRWRDSYPTLWPAMLTRVERWRKLDKLNINPANPHLSGGYEIQENKREKLMNERQNIYREFSRSLARRYAVIRIGKMDLRKMAQLETPAGEENELHARARRNRQRASLYLLQQEIKQQAPKFGAVVEFVDGPVTITCHQCGGRCAVSSNVIHVCEHCAAVWNQDTNAARNIFAAPRETSSDALNAGERSRQEDQKLTRAERMKLGRERSLQKKRSQIHEHSHDLAP